LRTANWTNSGLRKKNLPPTILQLNSFKKYENKNEIAMIICVFSVDFDLFQALFLEAAGAVV